MYEAKKPDHKEFFTMGLELPEDDPDVVAGEPLRGPNNWPKGMPEFRAALSAYYEAIGACGRTCCVAWRCRWTVRKISSRAATASGCNAPRSSITRRSRRNWATTSSRGTAFGLRLHHSVVAGSERRTGGAGTIEPALDPGAADPDTLVVNVGDLLERWTNNLTPPPRTVS